MLRIIGLTVLCGLLVGAGPAAQPATGPTTAPVPDQAAIGEVETIVIFRHGEKPAGDLGQLTPQGLNRAIALSTVLPQKFGRPDFLFAPDPGEKVGSAGGGYNYVRPLATIEPTAIKLGMPVKTPWGFTQIDQLDDELTKPDYASATVFVAWEHVYAQKAAVALLKMYGGDASAVPAWPGRDYDSLYIIKITRTPGGVPSAVFIHDHEGLDGQSKEMPKPAGQ
jgi:hypothetical protein